MAYIIAILLIHATPDAVTRRIVWPQNLNAVCTVLPLVPGRHFEIGGVVGEPNGMVIGMDANGVTAYWFPHNDNLVGQEIRMVVRIVETVEPPFDDWRGPPIRLMHTGVVMIRVVMAANCFFAWDRNDVTFKVYEPLGPLRLRIWTAPEIGPNVFEMVSR